MKKPLIPTAHALLFVMALIAGFITLAGAQAQRRMYLPVVFKPGVADPYYSGPHESEPNNATAQANGPLRPNFTYTAYPNDPWDIFSLAVTKTGKITVEVKGHAVNGGQVQLRRAGERDTLGIDTSPPDYRLEYTNATPGIYFVYVFVDTEKAYNKNQLYTIKVDYPTAPVPTVTPTRPGPAPTATFTPRPTATATPLPSGLPVLRNPDFELGDNGDWSEYSSNGYRLIVTSDDVSNLDAHGGRYMAWLGGLDDEVSVLWQRVTIPANAPSFYLYFYFIIQSKETNCSTTNTPDSVWLVIDDEFVEGYVLCRDTATTQWEKGVFRTDLRAWRGKTVDLQIAVFTDNRADTFSNFFLDDLSFSKTPPGSSPTPTATPRATATPTRTPTPTPTSQPVNLPAIKNAGFELGRNGDWTEYSYNGYPLIVKSNEVENVNAHNGQYLAWLGGIDDEDSILSQPISIPANVPSFYLYLYLQIQSLETNCSTSNTPDSFWLMINNDYVEGYVLCQNYATSQWVRFGFDTNLSAWKGNTVTLRIAVFTDDRKNSFSSLFIDDLSFSKTAPAAGLALLPVADQPPSDRGWQQPAISTPQPDKLRGFSDGSTGIAAVVGKQGLVRAEDQIAPPRVLFALPLADDALRRILPIPIDWYSR